MKTEDRIQQEIVQYYQNKYCLKHHNPRCLIAHVPNQNQQHLVRIGVLTGFSDLILIHFGEVLFVEVKTEKGTQSEKQIEFQERVEKNGFKYFIARSVKDLQDYLDRL